MHPFLEKVGKWVKEYGAIAPSSPFLARDMVRPIEWQSVRVAIEFGAGSGSITREALRVLPKTATLIAFELNPRSCEKLRSIGDTRLVVVNDRAEYAIKYLAGRKADCILSGVPIANLYDRNEFADFMGSVRSNLRLNGIYVQFQYFLVSYGRIRRSFPRVEVNFSPLNLPPAFIYICRNR